MTWPNTDFLYCKRCDRKRTHKKSGDKYTCHCGLKRGVASGAKSDR